MVDGRGSQSGGKIRAEKVTHHRISKERFSKYAQALVRQDHHSCIHRSLQRFLTAQHPNLSHQFRNGGMESFLKGAVCMAYPPPLSLAPEAKVTRTVTPKSCRSSASMHFAPSPASVSRTPPLGIPRDDTGSESCSCLTAVQVCLLATWWTIAAEVSATPQRDAHRCLSSKICRGRKSQ